MTEIFKYKFSGQLNKYGFVNYPSHLIQNYVVMFDKSEIENSMNHSEKYRKAFIKSDIDNNDSVYITVYFKSHINPRDLKKRTSNMYIFTEATIDKIVVDKY